MSQLTLLKEDGIPDNAEAVIINGPTSDFSADNAKKVSDYLAAGGKAFITATYTDKELPNFESILAEYQIQLEKGMVVEQDKNSYYQNPFYLPSGDRVFGVDIFGIRQLYFCSVLPWHRASGDGGGCGYQLYRSAYFFRDFLRKDGRGEYRMS